MAQRPAGGVAGREERGGHAHAVRAPQRHVEMGLALLDVADVIRPHPDAVAFLQHVEDEGFLDELPKLAGGPQARDAIEAWPRKVRHALRRRDRHHAAALEPAPATLVPVILGNIKNFELGESRRRFEQGRQEAWKKEQELLERLRVCRTGSARPKNEADDRPGPDIHRVPGIRSTA